MANRECYYITGFKDEIGYIPSLVIENEPGHSLLTGRGPRATPWYWGKTHTEAQIICKEQNAKLGLTERDVAQIVASSMRAR